MYSKRNTLLHRHDGRRSKAVRRYHDGYADCVEGAVEKGGIIGGGVYEPGKVKNTTVMERAYQMGKNV